MVIIAQCANCGIVVERRFGRGNNLPAVMCCSFQCKQLYARKNRPKKPCVVCGKEFEYYQSMSKRYVTCGDECRKKHKEGSRNGRWLGGFGQQRSAVTHSGKNNRWREEVLARDKVCVDCGSDQSLEVDHIQPWVAFPELRYEPSNGRVLCKKCHKKRARETYEKIKEAKRLGIYVPRKEIKTFDAIVCPNCLEQFIPHNVLKIFCCLKCQRNKYARDWRKKNTFRHVVKE